MSSYDKIKPGLGLGPNGHTRMEQAPESKQIKMEHFANRDQPAELGKTAFITANKTAPARRVYDRDYTKVGRETDEQDLVTAALGNPLRW